MGLWDLVSRHLRLLARRVSVALSVVGVLHVRRGQKTVLIQPHRNYTPVYIASMHASNLHHQLGAHECIVRYRRFRHSGEGLQLKGAAILLLSQCGQAANLTVTETQCTLRPDRCAVHTSRCCHLYAEVELAFGTWQ